VSHSFRAKAGNHMIKSAGKLNPWFPCHVIAIAKIESDCQYLFS
jgi:hypothetical protein